MATFCMRKARIFELIAFHAAAYMYHHPCVRGVVREHRSMSTDSHYVTAWLLVLRACVLPPRSVIGLAANEGMWEGGDREAGHLLQEA